MGYREEDILPGDSIRITLERTVLSFDGSTIETDEGESFETYSCDYEVTTNRPHYWPPQVNDVWKIYSNHLHYLGEELVDEDGDSETIADYLSQNGYEAADMTLVYRPGILDAEHPVKK